MLGEVASVITTGQRVLPAKALALGYRFKYPHLAEALCAVAEHVRSRSRRSRCTRRPVGIISDGRSRAGDGTQ